MEWNVGGSKVPEFLDTHLISSTGGTIPCHDKTEIGTTKYISERKLFSYF